MQDFTAVKTITNCSRRPEKPEIGIAGNSQMQHAVRPDELNLFVQVAEDVEAEFLEGSAGGTREIPKLAAKPNKEQAPKIRPAIASRP